MKYLPGVRRMRPAASIFHYKEIAIKEVKEYLAQKGIEVRLT